jgi:tetratricopeptide (TPR) repeat protein
MRIDNHRLKTSSDRRTRRLLFSRMLNIAFISLVGLTLGCLEPPDIGQAADPDQARNARPVFGGSTNTQLKGKLDLLVGLLDGKTARADMQKELEKSLEGLSGPEKKRRKAAMKEALANLPSSIGQGKPMPEGPERDMLLGRFYFSERRFIKAAGFFTDILDVNSTYPEARNLLARCFFFLGNADRTILELEQRLSELELLTKNGELKGQGRIEKLDALYLIGAAVLESPGTSRANMEKGESAWLTYMNEIPESTNKVQIEKGLEEIRAGLRGEGRLARARIVKQSAADGVAPAKGVTGGAASFRGSSGPAPKKPERVKNLPADASAYDRAVAQAWDLLDMRDPGNAIGFIDAADKEKPGQPEAMTARARYLVLTGQIPDALRQFGEVIKRHPAYMPAWHYNGMAHLLSGDPGQAASSWEKIKNTDPAYFAENRLAQRMRVAEQMARGQ